MLCLSTLTDMVNENEATRKLLQRWIKKKKKGHGIPGRNAKVGELEANAEKAVEEAQCRDQQAKGGTTGVQANKLPPNMKVTEVRVSPGKQAPADDDDDDDDDE